MPLFGKKENQPVPQVSSFETNLRTREKIEDFGQALQTKSFENATAALAGLQAEALVQGFSALTTFTDLVPLARKGAEAAGIANNAAAEQEFKKIQTGYQAVVDALKPKPTPKAPVTPSRPRHSSKR